MNLEKALSMLESAATTLAIVVGGIWAYFNFFKGRIYRIRLEPAISGRIVHQRLRTFLIVTTKLRNCGRSKVDITQKGSGFRVLSLPTGTDHHEADRVEWEYVATFPVFENHKWIEAGEVAVEEEMITLPPGDHLALLLELRVVAHNVSFKTRTVVVAAPEEASAHQFGQGEPT